MELTLVLLSLFFLDRLRSNGQFILLSQTLLPVLLIIKGLVVFVLLFVCSFYCADENTCRIRTLIFATSTA